MTAGVFDKFRILKILGGKQVVNTMMLVWIFAWSTRSEVSGVSKRFHHNVKFPNFIILLSSFSFSTEIMFISTTTSGRPEPEYTLRREMSSEPFHDEQLTKVHLHSTATRYWLQLEHQNLRLWMTGWQTCGNLQQLQWNRGWALSHRSLHVPYCHQDHRGFHMILIIGSWKEHP